MNALAQIAGARILVTGGSGLIGRPTVAHLRSLGADVTSFDRMPPADEAATGYVVGDLLDAEAVRRAVADVDAVVHLGGIPGLGVVDHIGTYRTNTVGTFVVLTEAALAGVAKVVYASSINASGYPLNDEPLLPARFPYDEDLTPRVSDWYSLSKVANEDAARMTNARWGTSITGLRFPLVRDITEDGGRVFGAHLRAAMRMDARRQAAEGWSYLDAHDAARSIEAALMSDTPPAPGVLVAAPLTYLAGATTDAVARFAPGSDCLVDGRAVGLNLWRSREWLGFEAGTLLDDVAGEQLIDIGEFAP